MCKLHKKKAHAHNFRLAERAWAQFYNIDFMKAYSAALVRMIDRQTFYEDMCCTIP